MTTYYVVMAHPRKHSLSTESERRYSLSLLAVVSLLNVLCQHCTSCAHSRFGIVTIEPQGKYGDRWDLYLILA